MKETAAAEKAARTKLEEEAEPYTRPTYPFNLYLCAVSVS